MANLKKTTHKGVYEIEKNRFCYRLNINKKGLKIDTTCRLDENGRPFTTMTAAARALEKRRLEVLGQPIKKKSGEKTYAEIYELYCENGTAQKAHGTIKKQKSMWEKHIKEKFGHKYVNDVSVGEINDYLANLYMYGDEYNKFQRGYSYKYVEGFLKFFYLLLNYAYAYECLDTEKYTKYTITRATRVKMPDMRQEDLDEDEGEYYDNKTIEKIWKVVKGGNFEIPFLLGYTLGTRISETFCIRWSNINWNNHTVTIDGQLLYEDGVWVISPVKTLQSVRTIHMPKNLVIRLREEYLRQLGEKEKPSWRATERVIDIRERNNRKEIIGGDFVCRKENGELMTPNSKTYWVKKIKTIGIDFHFHSLRKTHLTNLANLNTPLLEFTLRSGHKKLETAKKYYINKNAMAQKILKDNVESISTLSGLKTSMLDGIDDNQITAESFKRSLERNKN